MLGSPLSQSLAARLAHPGNGAVTSPGDTVVGSCPLTMSRLQLGLGCLWL